MDKWIKKLSSAVIASVLALTLSSKAYADPTENEDNAADDAVKTEIIEAKDDEAKVVKEVNKDAVNISNDTVIKTGVNQDEEDKKLAPSDENQGAGEEKEIEEEKQAEGQAVDLVKKAVSVLITEESEELADVEKDLELDKSKVALGDNPKENTQKDSDIPVGTIALITVEDGGTTIPINPLAPGGGVAETPDKDDSIGHWEYNVRNTDDPTDDSLIMEDFDAESITSVNCDLNIESTGLNHIETVAAGQNLTITGTGIMLIDNLRFSGSNVNPYTADGSIDTSSLDHFFLKAINGPDGNPLGGSVAVFLNANSGNITPLGTGGDASTGSSNNTYVLINNRAGSGSDTTGILNGHYEIPDGINLIMPSGTSIDLKNIPKALAGGDSNLGDTSGQYIVTSSSLTIPQNSTLEVNSGATINMSGEVKSTTELESGNINTFTYAPLLNVEGKLSGDGNVTGNGIVEISIEKGSNKPTTPAISPSCFEIVRRTDGYHYYDLGPGFFDLEEGLYDFLNNNRPLLGSGNLASEVFSPNNIAVFGDKWGDYLPLFKFNVGGTDITFHDTSVSAQNPNGRLISFEWGLLKLGQGGSSGILDTSSMSTGSGKLGGKNAGAISLVLKVTDKETYYNLAAYLEEKQIFELNNIVTVRFDYPVPTADGQLFAVFRNEDGSLTAFPARYDTITGQLVFNGDKLGNFVVVCVDYEGKLYTKEFYDFLETIESVKELKYGL